MPKQNKKMPKPKVTTFYGGSVPSPSFLHAPVVLSCPCPDCGVMWEKDLRGEGSGSEDYLVFPTWDEENEIAAECDNCDSKWKVVVVPELHVEVVGCRR